MICGECKFFKAQCLINGGLSDNKACEPMEEAARWKRAAERLRKRAIDDCRSHNYCIECRGKNCEECMLSWAMEES